MSTQARTGTPSGRLRSIDFLRGLAALSVLAHHAINYGWGQNMPMDQAWFRALHAVVDRGDLGVPLFFAISGFCIHLRWARARARGESRPLAFREFWTRRLHRLYPPYLVMLILSMGLMLLASALGRGVPMLARYPQPHLAWIAGDFFAHVFMLHGLHPVFDQGGGNPPFWTLAREEYLYALYFLLLAWRRKWNPWMAAGLSAGLGIAFPALAHPLLERIPGGMDWWPLVRTSALALWIQWSLGMVAVEADLGLTRLPAFLARLWCVPLFALAALAAERWAGLLAPALWGLSFFTLLNACVRIERTRGWNLRGLTGWCTRAGVFSYSLYLVHVPARAVVKQLLGGTASQAGPPAYLAFAVLFAVTGYWAGKGFFHLVERRFLNQPA